MVRRGRQGAPGTPGCAKDARVRQGSSGARCFDDARVRQGAPGAGCFDDAEDARYAKVRQGLDALASGSVFCHKNTDMMHSLVFEGVFELREVRPREL